ncbi:VOC family protein [Amycolatopsis magusensis]|uniref:VOC family protein n=1 Tax=Amycolatopsis magusensis TaxID=882444 RepID=UPI001AE10675|nr:VOC family protein [Amycolatopsis magusensis]
MSVGSAATQPLLSPGVPCWVELASPDIAEAEAFYNGLFGWSFELKRDPATSDGRYSLGSYGGFAVAGMYRAAASQPPGWTVHLSVHNTAGTAEWVEHLGGVVTLGPVEIPGRGNILHALDPTGTPIVFWQPGPSWEFATGAPNTFSGADLNTTDGAVVDQFYSRLFNYNVHHIGSETIDYAEWRLDHQPVLYRYVMGPEYREGTPAHWMIYFQVDPARGTDAAAGHALMLGGTVVVQPYDTPFGRVAVLADPHGSVFSVIDHTQVIDAQYAGAEVDDPYDD